QQFAQDHRQVPAPRQREHRPEHRHERYQRQRREGHRDTVTRAGRRAQLVAISTALPAGTVRVTCVPPETGSGCATGWNAPSAATPWKNEFASVIRHTGTLCACLAFCSAVHSPGRRPPGWVDASIAAMVAPELVPT